MRTFLGGHGAAFNFATSSMEEFGGEIASQHCANCAPLVANKRGRPRTMAGKRKKRYCAWNAFVAHAPKEPNLQAAISDGSRLQSLSARWGGMSEEEKMVYSNIALAKQAQFSCQSDSGSEDFHDVPDVPQGMPSHGCPWSLGAGRDCPLSPDLADTPKYCAGLQERVVEWAAPIDQPLPHIQDSLPFQRIPADDCCDAGACKKAEGYADAEAMLSRVWTMFQKLVPVEAFVMLAEGAGTTAQCFMVAHRRDRPRQMHVILLEPCGSKVLGDLIAGVNFPGDFDL